MEKKHSQRTEAKKGMYAAIGFRFWEVCLKGRKKGRQATFRRNCGSVPRTESKERRDQAELDQKTGFIIDNRVMLSSARPCVKKFQVVRWNDPGRQVKLDGGTKKGENIFDAAMSYRVMNDLTLRNRHFVYMCREGGRGGSTREPGRA